MQLILDTVTTLSIGLMIGTEFTVSAFINPIIEKLDDSARASATRPFAQKLGTAMPFWYSANLLLLIAETFAVRHHPGETLLVAASVLWIFVIVVTVIFLVPIAKRAANTQTATLTDTARRELKIWDTLHRWRVLFLSVAMICMLVGIRL